MRLSVIIFLSSFIFLSSSAQKNVEKIDDIPAIDSVLNRILADQHVAGFAVAVVKGGNVIYSKGFGYRDLAAKKPVTPNTLFAIGSSTKAFTASLLGLLAKDNKLKLDDKAVAYLPSLRFYNDEMNNQITIRDLMAHRTGLSRYDYSWLLFNTANRDSLISRVKFMQPTSGVREKWYYNNFMYLAQGMIVEKMTGKTWEQNIKEKFFGPLEMNRSNTDIKQFQNDADAALPYNTIDNTNKKVDYYNINGMGPAGSINSSVNDMANWLKVWISGGKYNGNNVLPTNYIAEAASAQMVISGGLPSGYKDIYMANYGLGWMLSSYRGLYEVEHGGNINGFSASVAFYPTEEVGIVVLTNQNGSSVPDIVRNSIVDRLFKFEPRDWNGEAKKAAEAAAKAKKAEKQNGKKNIISKTNPSHPLNDYVGDFETAAYGVVNITNEKAGLYAQVGENRLFLKHVHFDVFEPKDVDKKGKIDTSSSKNLFNFLGDNEGKVSSLTIQLDPDKEPVLFKYKPKAKVLDLKLLQSYVGDYELGKVLVKVYLKDKVLFVAVPGQQDYETVVVDDHTFDIKVLKGFSVKFEVLPSKNVASMSFIQPNGTFLAKRKAN